MARRPSEVANKTIEFSFTTYLQELDTYFKQKLIPHTLKHLKDEIVKKKLMSNEDVERVLDLATQVLTVKQKEAEDRVAKYLDAFQNLCPEKIMNARDYEEFYEARRKEVASQLAQEQEIEELMNEYSRKVQEQLLNRQMAEYERELQQSSETYHHSEKFLEATKDLDKVNNYVENMLKCLDVFQKKMETKIKDYGI